MNAQILLVEDDPISRTMIKGFLESRGYDVDAVGDAVSGIRLLQQGRYDLALVDYHLPEIDGYISARLMRDLGGGAGPKLAAITADHQGLMTRAADDAVFDGILTKPITPQALFDFVANMLADPVESPTTRAATAFLKMPRHELGRKAAAAFWHDRGLQGCPKAAVLPAPRLDQIEALSLCFDLCEPAEAELILVLDAAGLARLEMLREVDPAISAPAVDAGVDDDACCEAMFRVSDPSSWSAVAALVEGFASRRSALIDVPSHDRDLRLLTYLYSTGRPLRIAAVTTGALRIEGAGGVRPGLVVAAAKRLAARGLLAHRITPANTVSGQTTTKAEVYELSDLGRDLLTGRGTAAQGGDARRARGQDETKSRILLAIETPVNRDITASMLKAAGYPVSVASPGDMIGMLEADGFDLVVTEGEVSALARLIRAQRGPRARIPIIVLSAAAEAAEAAAIRSHGIDAVLRRPFRSRDLYDSIERLVKRVAIEAGPDWTLVQFEQTVFDGLLEFMEAGSRRYLLKTLAAQVEGISGSRGASDADRTALAADVHAMISAAGMLGFGGLSASCRSYCDALRLDERGNDDELRSVCAATNAYIETLVADWQAAESKASFSQTVGAVDGRHEGAREGRG